MFQILSTCKGGGYLYARTLPLHPRANAKGLYPGRAAERTQGLAVQVRPPQPRNMAKRRKSTKPSAVERTIDMFGHLPPGPEQETQARVTEYAKVQTLDIQKPQGLPIEWLPGPPPDEANGMMFAVAQELARLPQLQKLVAASTRVQRRGDWVEYRTPGGGTVQVLEPV